VPSSERAERPVSRVDFVNSIERRDAVSTTLPQPGNHELAQLGAFTVDDMVVVNSRALAAIKHGARAECGRIEIVVEHITWMDEEAAAGWSVNEGYEIECDGEPTLRCTLVLGTNGENRTEMGCLATAMHAVHVIPAVRAARPGVLDLADLHHSGALT
jgi:hypothetical protein